MKDVFGMEMHPGDSAVMWSDNKGRLLLVKILDYNPVTKKVKVERQGDVYEYDMRTYWTNAYPSKFYLLLDGT